MRKLYYDDPLISAYMAKEFGVSFASERGRNLYYEGGCRFSTEDCREGYYGGCEYIVAPDSLPIFEPQENDLIRAYIKGASYAYVTVVLEPIGFDDIAIIQRNGKPFFMPLVADE